MTQTPTPAPRESSVEQHPLMQAAAAGFPPSLIALAGVAILWAQLGSQGERLAEQSADLAELASAVRDLERSVDRSTADRWSRADQRAHEAEVDRRLRRLESRAGLDTP